MERLNAAAETGNIDAVYALIREDADLLKHIDEVTFVDTPLHIAACRGHTDFAMEMMTLMPSYARKLNPDGLSPLHLAFQNEKTDLILCLIRHDKNLIRVKGKYGKTLLHLAAEKEIHNDENHVLLTKFLIADPDCIQDVTNQGQTALHIALEKKTEAFEVLVGWLRRSTHKDAQYLEDLILNWTDYSGNTVLHIAAYNNQASAVRLLLDCQLEVVHTKNMSNKTALDMAKHSSNNGEIVKMLSKRRECGPRIDTPFTDFLKSSIPYPTKKIIPSWRVMQRISHDNQTRDSLLVVFVLVATAIYEVALSPPGGLWQGQLDTNSAVPSLFHESIHTIAPPPPPANLGKTIMDTDSFSVIVALNSFTLFLTLVVILVLFPSGLRKLLVLPLLLMYGCYSLSIQVISPVISPAMDPLGNPIGESSSWNWFSRRSGYLILLCLVIIGLYYWSSTSFMGWRRRKLELKWGTSNII